MILIDTSIWIRLFRRRSHPELEARGASLISTGQAAINPMILLELSLGSRDRTGLETVRERLLSLTNLVIADRTWNFASELGFSLRRAGIATAIPDLVISASAIEHDIVLLHADSDFDRIAEHSDLKVESHVAA